MTLPHPSECTYCARAAEIAENRRPKLLSVSVDVQTWCRVCGKPALLNVLIDYEKAVRQFKMLDVHVMTHEVGNHVESGGWGVFWRLDEVLSKIFPCLYSDDPAAPYWVSRPGTPQEAMHREVRIIHEVANAHVSPDVRESQRRRVEEAINRTPKQRHELEEMVGPVWDELELHAEFEVAGFIPPFVFVERRSDGLIGTVVFQQEPKLYWGFDPGRVI